MRSFQAADVMGGAFLRDASGRPSRRRAFSWPQVNAEFPVNFGAPLDARSNAVYAYRNTSMLER